MAVNSAWELKHRCCKHSPSGSHCCEHQFPLDSVNEGGKLGLLENTIQCYSAFWRFSVFGSHPCDHKWSTKGRMFDSILVVVSSQVDALIEAFGTTKQKRALNSRRLNEVGNDTLQQAVACAASNIIDQKGLKGNCRCCCNPKSLHLLWNNP